MLVRFSHEKKFITFIFSCALSIILILPRAQAQNQDGGVWKDSVNDIMIVAGAGLGGAVLGLSTLSFYEEPSDHYRNILVGGAIGIIVGVGIVAFNQANKTKESYGAENAFIPQAPYKDRKEGLEYSTDQRISWHYENFQALPTITGQAPQMTIFAHKFTF